MYRLVTRSDFDGLVCAMLLKQLDLIDDIKFVHPKDVQDGTVEITARDITTNLPYQAAAHLAFDHHASELVRNPGAHANYVIDDGAPSAARVVYDYYGGPAAFPTIAPELMRAVDKADSATYTIDEILKPKGWTLLNFVMDPRSGLGRFHHFRVSNYDLMMQLIDYCLVHPVEQILELPDVAERAQLYAVQSELFREQLLHCTRLVGEVAIVDLREEETIYVGNRFMVYALFPHATVSVHVIWGRQRQNTVLAVGKSIINRRSQVDIGTMLLEGYSGGGHRNAGTCQVPHEDAERTLDEVVAALNGSELSLKA